MFSTLENIAITSIIILPMTYLKSIVGFWGFGVIVFVVVVVFVVCCLLFVWLKSRLVEGLVG